MKNYLATASGANDSPNKYAMFVGRWQPWHLGHRWLIDQALNEDKKVLLCIRDVPTDEKNPWTSQQVYMNLHEELSDLIEERRLQLMIIPDIDSVNIGRNVGYDVIEHVPPDEIADVSATKIREQMRKEGKL